MNVVKYNEYGDLDQEGQFAKATLYASGPLCGEDHWESITVPWKGSVEGTLDQQLIKEALESLVHETMEMYGYYLDEDGAWWGEGGDEQEEASYYAELEVE